MGTHDKLKSVKSMYYCRSNLRKGCDHKSCDCKPLVISDNISNNNTNEFRLDLYDKNGKPVRIQCVFGNAKGKAKRSGARAMLEILM